LDKPTKEVAVVARVPEAEEKASQHEGTVDSAEDIAVAEEGMKLPPWNPADYREGECRHEMRPEWCAICAPSRKEGDAS
jgi:hypothetical protein